MKSRSDNGQDRNFDDLAARFKRNVYDRLKGDIRLAVLKRDLAEQIPSVSRLAGIIPDVSLWPVISPELPLNVLDAGGGQGQLSCEIAKLGHSIDLCDISAEMLALAKAQADVAGAENIHFIHDHIQNVTTDRPAHYDLVLCHAVLEWVVQPQTLIRCLVSALKPGGYLSLTFYNVNSIKMKNLLRTNFRKVIDDDYSGYRGSLTPTYPQETDTVMGWLESESLELLCHSGIRCFHDYILEPSHRMVNPEQQIHLELRLSRQEPFRSLGRYIHLLLKKGG